MTIPETNVLLCILIVEVALVVLAIMVGLWRILVAIRAEVVPQWTALEHPVPGAPHCGHPGPIAAVHSSGNTRCVACSQ